MPALMEILQSNYILAQVQAIRLLSYLAQKNDLLYDILNCQVHSNFLNLFQSTQPGSLLFELSLGMSHDWQTGCSPWSSTLRRKFKSRPARS
ncbi:unnamed protein product [Gulo gulo]|uniref:Uncharacterized protein n=1 Tax=Gulo gulo TaxID=48420 RepID=A0A9X9M0D1_GULGU|nr:unnamed protein product [Gulo gulo]